ncbi:MAG: AAA family ATPase [Candidatus Omnitrophica bacterium]|nr:AAA family ATPase [Candidatus Omnitrophota bacterium]
MSILKRIHLKGFRSIKEMDLELRPLNVLIGANGAGKSNLVAYFKMLNEMMGRRLQQFIANTGRAQANLHFGPKCTPQMESTLEFEVKNGVDIYTMRLFHAAGDTLFFAEETLAFLSDGWVGKPMTVSLGAGHQETRIGDKAQEGDTVAKVFRHILNHCRVFHFHDTSLTARVRQSCFVGDNRFLMSDAGNLAAMLYRWKTAPEDYAYQRIVRTIRQVAPFFDDFELEPEDPRKTDILLKWRHRESDSVFGPHQLSDGTLRVICLIALLLQPDDELPDLIVVDEPELGLHPYALHVIASLVQAAAQHAQVLISTQSSTFLDSFEPEHIIVVERQNEASVFARLGTDHLETWLEEYSLGEAWEKNVIGGGPI